MSQLLVTVFVLVVTVLVDAQIPPEAQIPEGYNVDVRQICGEEGANTTLCVKTDLPVTVKAICSGNNIFDFTTTDNVNFFGSVFFDGDETARCCYTKLQGTRVYVVKLVVNVIEGEGTANINREICYSMSCSYDKNGVQNSPNSSVAEQYHAPKEIQSHAGKETQLGAALLVTDVLGDPVDPTAGIPMDKYICLKVLLDNSTGLLKDPRRTGLFPVSCEAVTSTNGHRHAILRSGCGDGIILPKDQGFTIHPRFAISPSFRLFHLESDNRYRVMCNFTLCRHCIGKNSCSGVADKHKNIFDLFGKWIEAGNKFERPPRRPPRSIDFYPELSVMAETEVTISEDSDNTPDGFWNI